MSVMTDTIHIGARYRRPGEAKLVYRVTRFVEFNHMPHVSLVSENADRRTITIGVSVLLDPRQWVSADLG